MSGCAFVFERMYAPSFFLFCKNIETKICLSRGACFSLWSTFPPLENKERTFSFFNPIRRIRNMWLVPIFSRLIGTRIIWQYYADHLPFPRMLYLVLGWVGSPGQLSKIFSICPAVVMNVCHCCATCRWMVVLANFTTDSPTFPSYLMFLSVISCRCWLYSPSNCNDHFQQEFGVLDIKTKSYKKIDTGLLKHERYGWTGAGSVYCIAYNEVTAPQIIVVDIDSGKVGLLKHFWRVRYVAYL